MELSQEAREQRNAYMREWRRKNPDKVKKNLANHWERKAEQAKKEAEKEDN